MKSTTLRIWCVFIAGILFTPSVSAQVRPVTIPDGIENQLLSAKISGNLESFEKGLRGAPNHVVYDPEKSAFMVPSRYHEYGVGYGENLGIVTEKQPAYWMAQWNRPIEANFIQLTGTYPNQPQPETAWKIEILQEGKWNILERGIGGWYDCSRYSWGGPEEEPIEFSAMRVILFSKDESSPLKSIHFRGEDGRSWLVANISPKDLPQAAPFQAIIQPLEAAVLVDEKIIFDGSPSTLDSGDFHWDFGDGTQLQGKRVEHVFEKADIYRVQLRVSDGKHEDTCFMLVRVHTPETLGVPQVHLDTDQKNEQDDQHYFGYALFSELDILGVNSVHHGGGQEAINYKEILHVLELAKESGLPEDRVPFIFRGADMRLAPPASGKWFDTVPEISEASEAILASARGASPENPVWIVPVGPGTNVASAILQARDDGWDLKDRIRIIWLGGSNNAIIHEFNGNNDPWSMYVVAQSGIETWIVPAPVGARVRIDKRTEGDLYADDPLGRYLKKIVPAKDKPLFDASALSSIISFYRDFGWVEKVERIEVAGPEDDYRWRPSDAPDAVRVIREIDQEAMKRDLFDTMKGDPTPLVERSER